MAPPPPKPDARGRGRMAAAALILIATSSTLRADPQPLPSLPPGAVEVKVEKVRPERERLPTLRFLRANRDFIRARFDRLVAKPTGDTAATNAIDPRLLGYRELVPPMRTDADSARAAEERRSRQHLLESIGQLGTLENQIDLMERLLNRQRERLRVLEEDFTGHQRTALLVVVNGHPPEAPIERLTFAIEDGESLEVALSPEARLSLQRGGVLQIFHRLVEPRSQVVQVTLHGAAWPAGDSGFITIEPLRDRLTYLRLDLSHVRADRGGTGIHASTWLHEAAIPAAETSAAAP